ncbi:hypothetical protein [Schaalia sp. JY-X169]|uniref:hypothetical protein n=1 Tax=Schaalia sp. JY-X169 TaxID=2758572 RepID=UPI0015F651EE|nr:hypothetical protein [Schaalia sp. JY-X169]
MSHWMTVQQIAVPQTLAVLARPDVELRVDERPATYFCCEETGNGPYKVLGRIVKDRRRTRIYVHQNVATSELAFLTTVLHKFDQRDWRVAKTVDFDWYSNGEEYRRTHVCRPLDEDDLSMEAFEMVSLVAPQQDREQVAQV